MKKINYLLLVLLSFGGGLFGDVSAQGSIEKTNECDVTEGNTELSRVNLYYLNIRLKATDPNTEDPEKKILVGLGKKIEGAKGFEINKEEADFFCKLVSLSKKRLDEVARKAREDALTDPSVQKKAFLLTSPDLKIKLMTGDSGTDNSEFNIINFETCLGVYVKDKMLIWDNYPIKGTPKGTLSLDSLTTASDESKSEFFRYKTEQLCRGDKSPFKKEYFSSSTDQLKENQVSKKNSDKMKHFCVEVIKNIVKNGNPNLLAALDDYEKKAFLDKQKTCDSSEKPNRSACEEATTVFMTFMRGDSMKQKFAEVAGTMIEPCVALHKLRVQTHIGQIDDGEETVTSEQADNKTKVNYVYRAFDNTVKRERICYKGDYTADFGACKTAIYSQSAVTLSLAGAEAAQQLVQVNKNGKIAEKAANSKMGGGVQAKTSSWTQQKESLKSEANAQSLRAAAQATAGTVLLGNIQNIPTPSSLSDLCLTGQTDPAVYGSMTNEELCEISAMVRVSSDNFRQKVFMNGDIKNSLAQMAAMILKDSLISGLTANTLRKRAGFVGAVEAAFTDQYNEEMQSSFVSHDGFCEQNPTSPACRRSSGNRVTNTGIDFSGGGSGAGANGNINFDSQELDGIEDDKRDLAIVPEGVLDNLNDLVDYSAAPKSPQNFEAPGAAGVGGPGGGGGGGNPSASGGGGSGGGSAAAAAAAGARKAGVAGAPKGYGGVKSGKYTKGSGGISYKGRSSKKRKSKNPYNGILGGNTSRSISSTLKPKLKKATSSLFGDLSKKYSQMLTDGRLHKFTEK